MKKIPERYRSKYLEQHLAFTKDRLRFLALVFMAVFVGGSIIYNLIISREIPPHFIETGTVSLAACVLLLILGAKAPSMPVVKTGTFLLLGLLFLSIASNQVYVSMDIYGVLIMYLFVLFSVALIIPWSLFEIVFVGLLAACTFSLYFASVSSGPLKYLQGLGAVSLSCLICFFVRRYETEKEVENFLLARKAEDANLKMREELDLAISVHARLVPRSVATDTADIAVTYLPVSSLGGDYANFSFVDGEGLVFAVCDVTGHGVPAALVANSLHTEMENLFKSKIAPGPLLKELESRIYATGLKKTNMMLSAFCGFLDRGRMKLVYSNYGHPGQYVYRAEGGPLERLGAHTGMIGMEPEADDIYQSEIPVRNGDNMVLFTDGVTEARDAGGRFFGHERLEAFIKSHAAEYVNIFNERLLRELVSFTSNDFDDDIFILNIRIK